MVVPFMIVPSLFDHPEYDFDSNELVYRDTSGNELRREPLGVPINSTAAEPMPAL